MDQPLAAKLRGVPIFGALSDDALARIAAVVTEFEAPAGHVLTQVGQEGSGMFVLEVGSVKVELPDGATMSLGPGEFFGELSILAMGVTRTARVQASAPIRCLAIARRDFAAILEAEPKRLPRRDLLRPATLGGAGLPEHGPLQPPPERWPLRRVGAAGALLRGDTRDVQVPQMTRPG